LNIFAFQVGVARAGEAQFERDALRRLRDPDRHLDRADAGGGALGDVGGELAVGDLLAFRVAQFPAAGMAFSLPSANMTKEG
jgi:hypothetical protein